ncbi:MAG: hypothetical protein LBS12_02455, partial [Prevotellaceae bacterium]|nr:hypothetical protein [Prevotellaceae bacterium]
RGTPAAGFSSTVTVELTGPVAGDKFNWCAYVSDYPPNATPGAGFYDLHGTPPFIINGTITEPTRQFSGCIDALTDATGCPGLIPAKPEITAFTPLFDTICEGETVTLTATAIGASEYSFDDGATWQAGPTANVAPTTDVTYILKVRNAAGCTVTAAASAQIKVYPKPVASFSTAPSTACGGSSVTVVADGGSSYCFTHSCTACGRNPYRNGNDDPADFDCFFRNDSCVFGASNSYTFSMPDSGSITVCVRVINEHGCIDSVCTTIAVSVLPPAPILAGGGTYCIAPPALTCFGESGYAYQLQNNLLQNVGAVQTGAGAPLTFSLSATGTYTVVITDPATGCTVMSNAETVELISASITHKSGSVNQTVKLGDAINTITYTTTNATDATVTGLPPGLAGSWSNGSFTISGTPTTSTGTFTYTVSTLNCDNASATGKIITQGCNVASLTLGTVGFTSAATYAMYGGIIVSSPVTVTYCNTRPPSSFNGGTSSAGIFYADCANNTCNADAGNWFSACFVLQYKEQLCPSPWRVPTREDLSMIMMHHPNQDYITNNQSYTFDNPVFNAVPNGNVVASSASCVNHSVWMGSEIYPYENWNIRTMNSTSLSCCDAFWLSPFEYGVGVRCVRDP